MQAYYLLDTNILSEPIHKFPDGRVLEKIRENVSLCAVSSVTLAEMHRGIERMPPSRRKDNYSDYFQNEVLSLYKEIPFDRHAAIVFGDIAAEMEKAGRPRPEFDMLIAASAIANNMVLVTRNTRDFEGIPRLVSENWFE